MFKCEKCNKEFEKRHAYIGHCSSHNRGETYKIKRQSKKIQSDKKSLEKTCKFCGSVFSNGRQLGGHLINCEKNPDFLKIRESVKTKISQSSKGKKLSVEHKQKISESRKKYLNDNPGKIPYLLNHSSKESFPERIFREALEKRNITGWVQEYPIKRYSLDFAFVDIKIDVEIDGSTHSIDTVITKDKERDLTLEELGWTIIRIPAIDVLNDIDAVIESFLINLIL